MKKMMLISIACLLIQVQAKGQKSALNIPGLWQLVSYSKSENQLQKTAVNKQALVTSNEAANKTMLAQLKNTYRLQQQRYQTLGTVLSVADIAIQAAPIINRIATNQAQLYALAQDNPAVIALVYQSEIEFTGKARSLTGYLAGLLASAGDIDQMKVSDRKLLFDFVVAELNVIEGLSENMLNALQYARLNMLFRSLNPLQAYINQDGSIASQILTHAKYLK